MGWRFRKSVKILPGIRLNFGKKGITSVTVGGKFAKTNISNQGTYNTYSIPGTGLSYRTKISGGQANYPSSTSAHVQLNRYCQNCYKMNLPESEFCGYCGGVCPPNPQSLPKTSNDAKIVLGIVGGIFGFFMLCGLISLIGGSSRQRQSITPEPPKSSIVSNSNLIVIPSPQTTPKAELKSVYPAKTSNGSTAEVISENANLRKTSDQNAEVVLELPQGTSVTVLKQRGAWFLVQAASQQGWLHGNTIKLLDKNQSEKSTPNYSYSEPKPSYSPPARSVNPSGATARCRDGTLSYSASRRGTCSHHGGVAEWF